MSRFALALHGGAGAVARGAAHGPALREALLACLGEGRESLAAGASALDVVEQAVRRLESHPLFNAGRGSVLTSDGRVEMDAALMDGRNAAAGAVACVRRLAHPISAARRVLEDGRHVLLVGDAAELFALERGAETILPEDLVTEERRRQLEAARARGDFVLDHEGGTVGAVARDLQGHLAAATSTGGLTNQLPGRVGDTPLVGAGTWADDATCAVSATGQGEAFVRSALAHEVDAGLRLAGLSLEEACRRALERARARGGRGGLVAVDRQGRLALPFNSSGMVRGQVTTDEAPRVRIFAEE